MGINRVEVVINGNILSLQGDASEEHIQKVARVINEKLTEIQQAYDKTHLPVNKLNQLLVLNIADECVNSQEAFESAKFDLEQIDKQVKELKIQNKNLLREIEHVKVKLSDRIQHKKAHMDRGR